MTSAVAIPREVKDNEERVAITPAGVSELVRHGHTVLVERAAGEGSRITDAEFASAGAKIVGDADELWGAADILIKVKEPVEEEYHRLRKGLVLFAFLHLAADRPLTERLVESGTTSIAFETVQLADGSLPLLTPMSEIAGSMAPHVGANWLHGPAGGRGILLGGIPGVRAASVVVIGAGVAGTNAARVAAGMGAEVTILDISLPSLRRLSDQNSAYRTEYSMASTVGQAVAGADLVIGAVLTPGAPTPKVVSREMVASMPDGAVVVDVSVDQGGCFETSHATTHSDPVYTVDGVIHYCVANMPGALPRTGTQALTNATLPWLTRLANLGAAEAMRGDAALRRGAATWEGELVSPPVADAFGVPGGDIDKLIDPDAH